MTISRARLCRLTGLASLISYCSLLLAASLPVVLLPLKPLVSLKLGSDFVLHFFGVTPGLEVFPGRKAVQTIPYMSCFRVIGEGPKPRVLFDDFERCRSRRVDAVRDPFEVLMAKNLTRPLVDIDQGYRKSFVDPPMQPLFLLTDYFCHVPVAEEAGVSAVRIDSVYLGLNLDDGSTGQSDMGGRRACTRPGWEIRQP